MLNTFPRTAFFGQRTQHQTPRIKRRDSYCVSYQLVEAVPQCAVTCVEDFVNDNYGSASCGAKRSLDFLCTHNSGTGFTVGEAGLQCVVSDCTGTESKEVNVYNICQGVMGSIPETVATITATLVATSTENVSSFVQGTSTPIAPTPSSTTPIPTAITTSSSSVPSTTLVPSTTTTKGLLTQFMSASTSSVSVSSSLSNQPQSERTSGLTTPVIIGISVAGFAGMSLAILLVLCYSCRREKQMKRRRSERWSTKINRPPNDETNPTPAVASVPDVNLFPAFDPNQRYYAPPPAEERRRSFWRRSIKPEDIGVAVSPEIAQKDASPASISSQKTTSRLIQQARPAFSLFPVPSRNDAREKNQNSEMRQTVGMIVEEEPRKNGLSLGFETATVAGQQNMTLAGRPTNGQQIAPLAMNPPGLSEEQLQSQPPNSYITRNTRIRKSARLPLTPTYDNGNFSTSGLQVANPASYQPAAGIEPESDFGGYPIPPQYLSRTSSFNGQRLKRVSSLQLRSQARMRNTALHQSVASESTMFEDDLTPEKEIEKELGVAPLFSGQDLRSQNRVQVQAEERSPIKDLTYPRLPRPAAVSRQAENVPRPRAMTMTANHAPSPRLPARRPSKRDALVRAEQSFVQSVSTSPDQYPAAGSNEAQLADYFSNDAGLGLRVPTTNEANRIQDPLFRSSVRQSSEVFVDSLVGDPRMKPMKLIATPPPPQARLTPNRTRRGDLYLTVEG